jgi:hypothetical protein
MNYEIVLVDGKQEVTYRSSAIYDVGVIRHAYNPFLEPTSDPQVIRISTYSVRSGRRSQPAESQSPSQDTLSMRSTSSRRVPKTLGDTNEFISAFWVKGKPKCRKGYTYDFRRKMCRRI